VEAESEGKGEGKCMKVLIFLFVKTQLS